MPREIKNLAKRNKRAGSAYERLWAKRFRDIGYTHCKTARQASRLLDDSKVDLAFIPYNFQCKNVKASIKYSELFETIEQEVNKNFPPADLQRRYPIVIAHKKGSKKTEELVVMKADDFLRLVSANIQLQEKVDSMRDDIIYLEEKIDDIRNDMYSYQCDCGKYED